MESEKDVKIDLLVFRMETGRIKIPALHCDKEHSKIRFSRKCSVF